MARALDPGVTATFADGSTTWFSYASARAYNANARAPSFAIGAGILTEERGQLTEAVNITVGKIQWGAGAGGADIVSFYVFHDKDRLSETDFNAGALGWDTGHVSAKSTFNYLSIGGGRYFVDELRIGKSFNALVEKSYSGVVFTVR